MKRLCFFLALAAVLLPVAPVIAQTTFVRRAQWLFSSDGELPNWAGYGQGVAIDGGLMVIGDPTAENRYTVSGSEVILAQGAVFVYTLPNGEWVEHSRLTPEDPEARGTYFGSENGGESVSGDYVIVTGAEGNEGFIFERVGNEFRLQARLPELEHGSAPEVSVSGDRVAIGSGGGDFVDVYKREGTEWTREARLRNAFDGGHSVALDGDRLAALGHGDLSYHVVAVFELDVSGDWQLRHMIEDASDTGWAQDVALDGDRLVVGYEWYAHVYAWDGSEWSLEARLEPDDGAEGFGDAVDIDETFVVVKSNGGQQAVYVFERTGSTWSQIARLEERPGCWRDVAISGTYIVSGDKCRSIQEQGVPRAYVYEIVTGTGVSDEELTAGYGLRHYPNPVYSAATISYDLHGPSSVTLAVYDVLGRQLAGLASGEQRAGTHAVSFDATGLRSGIYFYGLRAGDHSRTRRMVVIR